MQKLHFKENASNSYVGDSFQDVGDRIIMLMTHFTRREL